MLAMLARWQCKYNSYLKHVAEIREKIEALERWNGCFDFSLKQPKSRKFPVTYLTGRVVSRNFDDSLSIYVVKSSSGLRVAKNCTRKYFRHLWVV